MAIIFLIKVILNTIVTIYPTEIMAITDHIRTMEIAIRTEDIGIIGLIQILVIINRIYQTDTSFPFTIITHPRFRWS